MRRTRLEPGPRHRVPDAASGLLRDVGAGRAQRWSSAHGPITILYRPARQRWLAEVMRSARNRPGIAAVPTTLQGVRQMLKALRRGEAVGLLPDQVPPQGLGLWSPFFGREAYTMTLAARLVQQTGASVILARCERLTFGRGYVLHLQDLAAPLAPELEAAVLQINQAMEQLIRQCPQQYLWGYAPLQAAAREMRQRRRPPGGRRMKARLAVCPDGPAGAPAAAAAARPGLAAGPAAVRAGRATAQGGAAQSCAVLSRGARGPAPRLGARDLRGVLPDLSGPQLAVGRLPRRWCAAA